MIVYPKGTGKALRRFMSVERKCYRNVRKPNVPSVLADVNVTNTILLFIVSDSALL
jgi:hypothetical protein